MKSTLLSLQVFFRMTALLLVSVLFASLLNIEPAHAVANDKIHYQGKLYTSTGSPVADGSHTMRFRFYDVSSGGTALWDETQTISTTGGLFTVLLGSVTSLSTMNWNQALFLGVTVDTDSEMTPRHTIGAVPAAHTLSGALRLDTATASYLGGKLSVGTTTLQDHILSVTGTGASNTAVLALDVSGAGLFKWASASINPDMAAGNNLIHMIGQAESTLNSGYMGFNYQAASSTSNFLTFGLYDVNNILNITGAGNVGIGTTTPTAQLHTTGSVRFSTFGAGSLSTDASGNLTVSSDERLKDITGSFDTGLAAIRGLEPIRYRWNAESGLEQEVIYAGFSAQNVMNNIEDAVGVDKRGYYTLNDRPIIAASVNAIKELDITIQDLASTTVATSTADGTQTFVGKFLDRMIAWFANAANGIGNLFANSFRAKDTLCINDTCVDETKLREILGEPALETITTTSSDDSSNTTTDTDNTATSADEGIATSTDESVASSTDDGIASSTDPIADTEAPVITMNSNSSVTLTVGDTYTEEGAVATDNVDADVQVVVTGTVDTATAGTYEITYTTTDTAGNESTAIRTVTVNEVSGI